MKSNILVNEHGRACLADYSLSNIRTYTTAVIEKSMVEVPMGSVRWMAPEQMRQGSIDHATDAYSFGMTMYEVRSSTTVSIVD